MSVVSLLLAIAMLVIVAVNFRQGVWACAIQLIAVIFSAIIATMLFEPFGALVEKSVGILWQYGDFLGAWLIFGGVLGGLTYLSTRLSKVRVRFPKLVDQLGGLAISLLTAWVFVCFASMTLHIAPISRVAFFGSFEAEKPIFFGYRPDWAWLEFSQNCSLGVYSNGNVFDPKGDFIIRGIAKREHFDLAPSNFEARGVIQAPR